MHINSNYQLQQLQSLNNQNKQKEISVHQSNEQKTLTATVPVGLHAAYSKINFKGRPYDKTNFRAELKERAQHSTTSLKLYPDFKLEQNKETYKYQMAWDNNTPEQELELYTTKHSEYVINPATNKLYKIKYVDDKERITQQIMASKLYQCVGVRTPEYIPFEKNGATGWLVEVIEEKLEPQETNKKALYESFIADVWLGNRNGLSKENTKIDKDGNPVKISVSGSLGYRASGKIKDETFGYGIPELQSMRDFSKNPDAATALKEMTDDDLYEAIKSMTEKYNSSNTYGITKNYRHAKIYGDLDNTLGNRIHNLENFESKNKNDIKLASRGLTVEGTPSITNLKDFKPNDATDIKYALEITDEQWQKLEERGLLQKEPGCKSYRIVDLTYLAKMTDEEHKRAQERGLYYSGIAEFDFSLVGSDIATLSKISDENWKNVEKHKLLDIVKKYHISGWQNEFIADVSDIDDVDWAWVKASEILNSFPDAKDIKKFIRRFNSPETEGLVPSYLERIQILSLIDKDKLMSDKNYRANVNLNLAEVSNENWQKMVDMTKNFTDTKLNPSFWYNIFELDDASYNLLKERGMLEEAINGCGLDDLAALSEEDWANIDKRGIKNLKNQGYSDWAHLASMSDKNWQIAVEKNLFENRTPDSKYGNYFSGEEIALLVDSLDEKDWKNVEKRELISAYRVFDGFTYSPAHGYLLVKLAKLSDNDFIKFNKVHSHCTIYPSTVLDLLTLNDEQFKKLFERDLFKYMDTHESWDNYLEDAPVMMTLAELSDEEYQSFLNQKNNCKTIKAKALIIKAEKLGLDKKQKLNEFSIKEKREYLDLLLNKGQILLSKDFEENFNCSEIVPKSYEEYNTLMKQLIKSVGIDTNPISEADKTALFEAIDKLSAPNSEFRKMDLKNPEFRFYAEYPREKFKNDILDLVKNLDETEQSKVWDYFGFEIKPNVENKMVMSGYPALINNGHKLAEIESPETKSVIEQIRPYVKKFTEGNKILPDNRFVSKDMANTLNDILKVFPELHTIVGKKQHQTHNYTVDVHTLAVLQECINNPKFEHLTQEEKQTLVLTSLLHDITKEEFEIDKAHPRESSYDAYFILQKLGLPKQQRNNIYQLIKNHDLLEQCNKYVYNPETQKWEPISDDEQDKILKKYAYEFRSGNIGELALMLTKADLLGVKRDGSFYDKYCGALEKVSKKLRNEIKTVKSTAIPLPQTTIPSASELIADGINVKEIVTYDKNGNEIKNKVLYMKKGLDLSKYGFDKGVTSENFNVIIHGFDTERQQIVLDALELPDQEALLSTSYVIYDKGNYRAFRQQGFIKEVLSDDIGAAYYRDFGSGCKKTTRGLINDYLNGNQISYRKYIPQLIKDSLKINDEQYIELYEEIKNKPLDVLEQEKPQVASVLKDIFAKMEVFKRKFQRNYNEALITKGENKAIYFYGKNKDNTANYEASELPEHLRKYAQEKDIPIIYFGE